MLASITPLGERGRNGHWWITLGAMLVGAAGAGAAAGALLGALGALVLPAGVGPQARLATLALALAAAIALDGIPGRVPGPRRQVNERWLDQYRGWVYGLGYGAQFGLAVTTVVTSAATYATLLAAFLAGTPARGAVILGLLGAIRGLTPLAGAHVRTPDQLLSLHRRLAHWRPGSDYIGRAALAAIFVLALAASLR
jgi:hypothetical protein